MSLTYSCSIITEDGVKDFAELSSEQRKQVNKNWSRRLSDVMSDYYTNHPQEVN